MASNTLKEHNTSVLEDIHEEEPPSQQTDAPADEYSPPRPKLTDSESTENRLRPAAGTEHYATIFE